MTTAQFAALDGQLRGYLDHLTIERGVAANTISSYRRDLRRYGEHLNLRGIDDLRAVTETDVSDFLVALRRGDPDDPEAIEFRGHLRDLGRMVGLRATAVSVAERPTP